MKSKKLTKKQKTDILKMIQDDNKILRDVVEELGITDLRPPQVRKQLVEEYGEETIQTALQTAREKRIPPVAANIKRMLENKGDALTEDFCSQLIDQLADAIEVVYLAKEDLSE